MKMRKRRIDRNKKFGVRVIEFAGKEPFMQRIEKGGGDLNGRRAVGYGTKIKS